MSYPMPRPGLAIAAGILLITYGSLGLLGVFCGSGAMLMQQGFQQPLAPGEEANLLNGFVEPEVAKEVPSAPAVETAFLGVSLLLSLAMIVAGIGVLQMKPMGRWLAMAVAVVDIVVTLAHTAYSVILILPVQHRLLQEEAPNMPPGPFNMIDAIESATWGMTVFGVLFTLAIWVTVLCMLNSKSVRAAFADEFEPTEPPSRERARPRYDDDDDDLPPPSRSAGDTGITDRPGPRG